MADPHPDPAIKQSLDLQPNKERTMAHEQKRTRDGAPGKSTGKGRICRKCGQQLDGQFVRALGGTYHLECFRCQDCSQIVANKFFPCDEEDGSGQYPLCETDYFRRLNLLCYACGGALRGSYITAIDRKYHIEHFTCSACPTIFGAQDSYYEHDGKVYCHYHYSTQFAERCTGCYTAILKQFVEIFRGGYNQHWHPECYMIHKFWNVRLAFDDEWDETTPDVGADATPQERATVREMEEQMEEKVYKIWRVLATFEESSAGCISDMLLHVSNGAYIDGVVVASRFIWHVDILFRALDRLDASMEIEKSEGGRAYHPPTPIPTPDPTPDPTPTPSPTSSRAQSPAPEEGSAGRLSPPPTPPPPPPPPEKGIAYGREARLLCKKIVSFFNLLSRTQDTGVRKLGVTQELLSLVTALAHYLKLLIRISLQGALKLERITHDSEGLRNFLNELQDLESVKEAEKFLELTTEFARLADENSDLCMQCNVPVNDECTQLGDLQWHVECLVCANCARELGEDLADATWSQSSQRILCQTCVRHAEDAIGGIEHVRRLKQFVYLLRVALARLLAKLRAGPTLPHTSDDPNLEKYDSTEGHRVETPQESLQPPLLRSNTRSKSYGGEAEREQDSAAAAASYEETLGAVRRLRSTRMDKPLSSTSRKARTSRIIDGPSSEDARSGSAAGAAAGAAPDANGFDPKKHSFHIVEDKDSNGESRPELTFDQEALTLDDIPRIVAVEQAKEHRPNAFRHAGDQLVSPSGLLQPKLFNGHQHDLSGAGGSGGIPTTQRVKRYFSELSALEYFIVRHVAVLSMEPLLEGQFNLEELLALIEPRKMTIWSRFGFAGVFKGEGRKVGKKKGVFGVNLDTIVDRDPAESTFGVGPGALRVPGVLDDMVSAMRRMDMAVEGVFRKNGNIRKLRDIADLIDKEGGDSVDLNQENAVQVAALLKKFLRDLPEPLLTIKLYRLFLASQKIADPDKKRRVLHLTCCLLPKVNRDSMEVLFSFLNWVASFSHVDEETGSKMDVHNLATVITPNILYTQAKAAMDESFLAIEAVHQLIEYNDTMCEVPEDLQNLLSDGSLLAANAEMTTKEILKRYASLPRAPEAPAAQHGGNSNQHRRVTSGIGPRERIVDGTGSAGPSGSAGSGGASSNNNSGKEGRGNVPMATRIETDPSQARAWQQESSVRHVSSGRDDGYPSSEWVEGPGGGSGAGRERRGATVGGVGGVGSGGSGAYVEYPTGPQQHHRQHHERPHQQHHHHQQQQQHQHAYGSRN